MAKKYKKHYVNSVIGRVHIDIGDHGVVLKQEIGNVTTGSISLIPILILEYKQIIIPILESESSREHHYLYRLQYAFRQFSCFSNSYRVNTVSDFSTSPIA